MPEPEEVEMPLINCPDCDHQVSNLAPACPSCGRIINETKVKPREGLFLRTMNLGCAVVLAFLVLIVIIGVYLFSSTKTAAEKSSRPAQVAQSELRIPGEMVVLDQTRCFSKPDSSSDVLVTLERQYNVVVTARKGGWAFVTAKKTQGWVPLSNLYQHPK